MPQKTPTAKEFLSDPKYNEQKGFFKELLTGLAAEMREEAEKNKGGNHDADENIFDTLFDFGKK